MAKPRFRKIVEWTPAFDRRDPTPSKNYGIHGMELRFVLKGPEGAVQFLISTNWQLPHVAEEQKRAPAVAPWPHLVCGPTPADIGYHSSRPIWEYQVKDGPAFDECPWLDGQPCYYEGSGLHARDVFAIFTEHGEQAMWDYLRAYYEDTFDSKEPKPL